MRTGIRVLKAKVRGFELEAGSLRKRFTKLSGEKRWAVQQEKRDLGTWTRLHLVAYGLLRGVPYEVIERKTRSPLQAELVMEVIHTHLHKWETREWSLERVKKLLTVSPVVDTPPVTPQAPEKSPEPANQGLVTRVLGMFR